jgi:hypothetical protein
MNRVATCVFRSCHDLFAIEIGGGPRASEAPRFVGSDNMQRVGIIFREDGEGSHAERGRRFHHANRNFTAIRDQQSPGFE